MSIIGGLSRRPSCRTGSEKLALRRPGSQMQNNRGRAAVRGGRAQESPSRCEESNVEYSSSRRSIKSAI